MKPIEPNFKTPDDQLCKEELNKINSDYAQGTLKEDFRNLEIDHILWESEQLAKSHGIYLEFNRAVTGTEKEWMYMIRITIPGGGPLSREQWKILDTVSDKYTANPDGLPSIRLTTRQNIQFHWIKHRDLKKMIQEIAETGFYTLNGCGDNVRNVMASPRGYRSKLYDPNILARKFGTYFRVPEKSHIQVFEIDPTYIREDKDIALEGKRYQYGKKLLNRKFKIGFTGVEFDETSGKYIYDNSVEALTNDLAIAPIVDNGKVERFQIYIGGGQGEKNGKPTMARLAEPLCIVKEKDLLQTLDAVVKIHEEWGDRQNRIWARIKYVVEVKGIAWFQERLKEKGITFELPDLDYDIGARELYYGWHKQSNNGKWSYGAFIECGRLIDGSPNGDLKKMASYVMDNYPIQVIITPNQDLLFIDIPENSKAAFEADLKKFGFGERFGKPYSTLRKKSVACVGLYTCRLSYTESEQYLPVLIDELEKRGYADVAESIGISGCERQCSRPATKTIGLVGGGKNLYRLKLLGSEDARHQGQPIIEGDEMYLSTVHRDHLPDLISVLFDYYHENKNENETMGYFIRRIGIPGVVRFLKENQKTAPLMEKVRKVV